MESARVVAPVNSARARASRTRAWAMAASLPCWRVVQVVGLGGGEEDAVDAAAEDRREPGARAGAEAGEDLGHGGAQVLDGARAVVDGAERVDEHDLAVEAGEVVAEEGVDDDALVGLEALVEGAPERVGGAAVGLVAAARR